MKVARQAPMIIRMTLVILLCLAGAAVVVNILARVEFHSGGLSFSSQVRLLVPGETQLSLPPLGIVSASTHLAPVGVHLELRGLNPSLLRVLSTDPDARDRLLNGLKEQAQQATIKTALLAIFLGGLGSLLVFLLLKRSKGPVLIGIFLMGCIFCGALLAWTYLDYNLDALKQPRYEGMLESAPWIMSVLSDSLQGLERLGQGFEVMARNLSRLSNSQNGAPMSDIGEDLRVLHVSDIHNNETALDLIASLVANFGIDIVIDTGDLTDFGTAFESDIAKAIGRLRVPYVFVPGNHDSPDVVARLRRTRNVVVCDGKIISIKGLNILGLPDPSAERKDPGVVQEELAERGAELKRLWEKASRKPDLVAAHNRDMLAPLIGVAPVLVHGHQHQASLRVQEDSVIVDAGTTGAAGLRGLASEEDVPYTVVIQYWHRERDGCSLLAIDSIRVGSLDGTLNVKRTYVSAVTRSEPAAG